MTVYDVFEPLHNVHCSLHSSVTDYIIYAVKTLCITKTDVQVSMLQSV